MFRSFLPKDTSFFDYFEQHIEVTIAACKELLALTSNGSDIPPYYTRIKDLEHQADKVTHKCIEALHSTFITPIERGDILNLIMCLDDIMDMVDAAASRMALYEIKEMRPEAKALAEVLVESTQQLAAALKLLRNLKDPTAITNACVVIQQLENDGDDILRAALARLFKEENDNPILVIKWNAIFEILETGVDKCEDAADIITGVVIEAS